MTRELPQCKVVRSVDLIEFLNYCIFKQIINEIDKNDIIANLSRNTNMRNDSHIGGYWLYDASEYCWNSNTEVMHLIGLEFRKAYPERVDLLWISW